MLKIFLKHFGQPGFRGEFFWRPKHIWGFIFKIFRPHHEPFTNWLVHLELQILFRKINPAKVCSLTKKWQYLYKSRAINHFRFKTGPNMFFFFSYLAHLTFQKKLDKVLGKRIFPKFAHDECPVYQVTPPMPTELLLRFLLSSSTTIRLFIGPLDVTFQNKTSRISGEKKHR